MITLYSGTPGAGKSLHLASRLYHWMQYRNAPIIANFTCDFSTIKKPKGQFIYIDNSQLMPERLIWFSKNYEQYIGRRPREGEILLVIDEAQLLFNSREWVKTDRAEWCAFFTQHRKLGYEVVLVAQMDRMLDRQIRGLVEYEWIHRKCSNFGVAGKLLGVLFGGKLFVAVKVWYPMKRLALNSLFTEKDFRIFMIPTLCLLFQSSVPRGCGEWGFRDPATAGTRALYLTVATLCSHS